jgi:hypothetical protein
MPPCPDNGPPEGGPDPQRAADAPEALEIFKHAGQVTWEKPLPTALFVLALALVETLSDLACASLLEPFAKPLEGLAAKGPGDAPAVAALREAIGQSGASRLALGMLLPFLTMPFVSFSLCRAALSIWDGYIPGPRDLALALASYFRCLSVFLALALLGMAIGLMTASIALPLWIVSRSLGGGTGRLIEAAAVLGGVILWIRFVWPSFRQYFFLQFFVYFRISDHPGLGGLFRETARIYVELKEWPSHLNMMCAQAAMMIVATFVFVQMWAALALNHLPRAAGAFISNAVFLAAFLWPLVGAAGFYRLCLRPTDGDCPPAAAPGGEGNGG